MRFEIGPKSLWVKYIFSCIADRSESLTDGGACLVFLCQDVSGFKFADKGTRAHHDRDKT